MESRTAIVRDMILYTVFLIAAAVFHIFVIPSQTVISIAAKADFFAPDTFPKLLTRVIALFSAAGLVLSAVRYTACRKRAAASNQTQKAAVKSGRGQLIPFIVVALIGAYILFFSWIGFVPATLVFPPLILFVIGGRNWKYYLIYYIFAAVMYVLFKYVMLVPIH